jgi:hypothetical protein
METIKHSNGTYTVEVRKDGAIFVKPGDWLSKYAAAIYNNPGMLDDFYWPPLSSTEDLRPITNKHRLEIGDTVIHKPTWDQWRQGGSDGIMPRPEFRPGDMDTQEFLRRLEAECGVRGERIARMSSLLTGTKWQNLSEASALKQLGMLAWGTNTNWQMLEGPSPLLIKLLGDTTAQAVGGAMSFLVVFKFTFQALVTLLDAQESGLRFQGLRAIAYATTAFAFGDPVPALPWGIECNLSRDRFVGALPMDRYRSNWANVSSRATAALLADAAGRGVDKQVYQAWIRWEANDRRALAVALMDATARGMSRMLPVDRDMFMSPVPIYPNDWRDDRSALCY